MQIFAELLMAAVYDGMTPEGYFQALLRIFESLLFLSAVAVAVETQKCPSN